MYQYTIIVPEHESFNYVVTEDCYIVGYLHGFNSTSDKFFIDNILVADVYNEGSDRIRNLFLLPLKKGQVLMAKSDYYTAFFTVYAML